MNDIKILALYLPQYHPTETNNKWWGKGFTEWTNVAKAKPLFKGHYQPKIPSELGFYDLRLESIRKEQAELANKYGINGFCYYHYWFGNGKQELDFPFKEVLKLKEPNFPFCLCWANESWHSKYWNIDGSCKKKLIIEQEYLGKEDYKQHFMSLLTAFKDNRYIKINNKPIFMIYKPLVFKDITSFIELWNDLAIQNGFSGMYFIGQTYIKTDISMILRSGFDAVNLVRLFEVQLKQNSINKIFRRFKSYFFKKPFVYPYNKAIKHFIGIEESQNNIFPTIIPNWDHTPRSEYGGFVLHNSNPHFFKKHVMDVLQCTHNKQSGEKIIFIKSWNEWGEGNYLEPDLKFGTKYLETLKECIKLFK